MKVLLTGASGLLGRAMVVRAPSDVHVVGTWRTTPPPDGLDARRVDLADAPATAHLLQAVRPDVVVHLAYGKDDLGRDVVDATAAVADATAAVGAGLVHMSSDVVFSGEDPPYGEPDPPSPCSAYGRAKAAAEAEVEVAVPDAAIVRTSLIVTPGGRDPRTPFVTDALRAGRPVDLYVDEVRMPVHRDDLADALWRLVARDRARQAGVWHLVGEVALSRLDLGHLVCDAVGGDPTLLRGVHSPRDDDPRPRDLRLTCARARRELDWRPRDVRSGYGRSRAVPSAARGRRDVDGHDRSA